MFEFEEESRKEEERGQRRLCVISNGKQPLRVMWNDEEIAKLGHALEIHGRDWAKVTEHVGTKTHQQCQNKVKKELYKGHTMRRQGNQGFIWTKDGIRVFDLSTNKGTSKPKRKRSRSASTDTREEGAPATSKAKTTSDNANVVVGARERLAASALLSLNA